MIKRIILVVFVLISSFFSSLVYAQKDENAIQTAIHLLGYVARDYAYAVEDGEVIDDGEYEEQIEFSAQAYQLSIDSKYLAEDSPILQEIKKLRKKIDEKVAPEEINALANGIKSKIIETTGVATAPNFWPNQEKGAELYQANCVACHGPKGAGDGPNAEGLDPEPTNLLEIELMEQVSAYQVYNTIKLGVEGTSMMAYNNFTEDELWDLAFYIKSMRFETYRADSILLRKEFDKAFDKIGLDGIASLSDIELADTLSHYTDQPEIGVRAFRLLSPSEKNLQSSLETARKKLNEAVNLYREGDKKAARTAALNAYLEGIEPVESRLRGMSSKFVIEIEHQMYNVRQAIEQDEGLEKLEEEKEKAFKMIDEADKMLESQKLNYWLTFVIAASIFLREGLEAFLVIAVILALIRSSGSKKALVWLHGGWLSALLLGIAGWFLSDYIIQFGGKNREIMEGLVSLFAVVILLWAGFWLHSNSTAQKWQHFIKDRIGGYLAGNNFLGLAAFAFMVVFREAFEVILFLQALSLEVNEAEQSAIGLGVLAATVAIAIMAYLFLKYSKRLPIRQLFRYSSWVIILLAIILVGKGVHSLQESGWIGVSSMGTFHFDWLGIYPTWETIGAQIIVIVIIIVSYLISKNRSEKRIQNSGE